MSKTELTRISELLKHRHGEYAWDVASVLEEISAHYGREDLPGDGLSYLLHATRPLRFYGREGAEEPWRYLYKLLTGEEWVHA